MDERRRRRRIRTGVLAWLTICVVVSEFLSPPFDPVRPVVRLVPAGLVAWCLRGVFTRDSRDRA
ncbi:hypothetical protein SAMN05661080_00256 [Modestobacter sp. DSM 44400]|nr:hypothetical protein SAMN05661080_00256 [Modestobacter sp. DSM 44400]